MNRRLDSFSLFLKGHSKFKGFNQVGIYWIRLLICYIYYWEFQGSKQLHLDRIFNISKNYFKKKVIYIYSLLVEPLILFKHVFINSFCLIFLIYLLIYEIFIRMLHYFFMFSGLLNLPLIIKKLRKNQIKKLISYISLSIVKILLLFMLIIVLFNLNFT